MTNVSHCTQLIMVYIRKKNRKIHNIRQSCTRIIDKPLIILQMSRHIHNVFSNTCYSSIPPNFFQTICNPSINNASIIAITVVTTTTTTKLDKCNANFNDSFQT
jgi:hypothetical protein